MTQRRGGGSNLLGGMLKNAFSYTGGDYAIEPTNEESSTQGTGEGSNNASRYQVVDRGGGPNWLQRNFLGGDPTGDSLRQQVALMDYQDRLAGGRAAEARAAEINAAKEARLYDYLAKNGMAPTPEAAAEFKRQMGPRWEVFVSKALENLDQGFEVTKSLQDANIQANRLASETTQARREALATPEGSSAVKRGSIAGWEMPYTQQRSTEAGTEATTNRTMRENAMAPLEQQGVSLANEARAQNISQQAAMFPGEKKQQDLANLRASRTPVAIPEGLSYDLESGDIKKVVRKPVTIEQGFGKLKQNVAVPGAFEDSMAPFEYAPKVTRPPISSNPAAGLDSTYAPPSSLSIDDIQQAYERRRRLENPDLDQLNF